MVSTIPRYYRSGHSHLHNSFVIDLILLILSRDTEKWRAFVSRLLNLREAQLIYVRVHTTPLLQIVFIVPWKKTLVRMRYRLVYDVFGRCNWNLFPSILCYTCAVSSRLYSVKFEPQARPDTRKVTPGHAGEWFTTTKHEYSSSTSTQYIDVCRHSRFQIWL